MKNSSFAILLGVSTAAVSVMAQGNGDKWDIKKLDASKLPAAATTAGVTFDKDIKPIFQASCFGCHGDKRQRGGLRLDSLEATLKGGDDGKIVVPGDSAKSLLVMAISQTVKGTEMPPKPRARRPGGPGGPGGAPPPQGGPGGPPAGQVAPPPDAPPGGPGGPGGPGRGGPPAKPLTTEQVALVRAWIDQGAK